MLKKRIIPTLLWKNEGLVKGCSFDSWRRVGPVLPAVKVYNLRKVDELILMDITATCENRDPDYDSIKSFASDCFVPFTVGGGIRNIDQIRSLLKAGADKIAINTAAYKNLDFIKEASNLFGRQCIVVGIDFKYCNGKYECYSSCGTVATGLDPLMWVQEVTKAGAGEILLTSIDLDGTMNGYDIQLTKKVVELVDIPIIASGGAGCYEDVYDVFTAGGADAAAMASMYHFTEQTPLELKQYLSGKNINVRLV